MSRVLILMGSSNDWSVMQKAGAALDELDISWEAHVSSAHRSPDRTAALVQGARENGVEVIVCGAGMAAHLAGVVAAQTVLPVIAVPIASGALGGLDALLASVQMPPGVPVATVAVDGARNAGILAAQVMALHDEDLTARLENMKEKMAAAVEAAEQSLQEKVREA